MRALRIPRKDHDVYCIDITGEPKRQLQAYIDEQLLRMHPVYGVDTVTDVKRLKHNEHEWAIVTVMRKDTLEEYRILYPHTAFVTATSLAVFEKDFFTDGMKEAQVRGCERIWFDEQKQLIISEETENAGISHNPDKIPQEREEPVIRARPRSVVFSRKRSAYLPVGIGLGVIVAAVLTAYIVWTAIYPAHQATVSPEHRDMTVETETKETLTVTPCRFLEMIAEHAPAMQAVFERYRYADAEGALCTFRSTNLENSITAFQTVPHRSGCSIREITQKDKQTVVTVQTEPAIRQATFIPTVDPAAIAGFTDALKTDVFKTDTAARHRQNTSITMNGLSITISVLIKTETIDAFLHDIEVISSRYSFGMNVLEVAAAESEILSVHAEFQQIGENDNQTKAEQVTGHVPYTIAHAFGYAKKETAKPIPQQIEKTVKKDTVIPEGSVEIGKIKTDGKIKIYYRTPEGKIISIESKS